MEDAYAKKMASRTDTQLLKTIDDCRGKEDMRNTLTAAVEEAQKRGLSFNRDGIDTAPSSENPMKENINPTNIDSQYLKLLGIAQRSESYLKNISYAATIFIVLFWINIVLIVIGAFFWLSQ